MPSSLPPAGSTFCVEHHHSRQWLGRCCAHHSRRFGTRCAAPAPARTLRYAGTYCFRRGGGSTCVQTATLGSSIMLRPPDALGRGTRCLSHGGAGRLARSVECDENEPLQRWSYRSKVRTPQRSPSRAPLRAVRVAPHKLARPSRRCHPAPPSPLLSCARSDRGSLVRTFRTARQDGTFHPTSDASLCLYLDASSSRVERAEEASSRPSPRLEDGSLGSRPCGRREPFERFAFDRYMRRCAGARL